MNLLGPIPFAIWGYVAIAAAALAVGAYIIKMRRRRFEVPFSQLWQRVLQQKDAHSLWKQLKRLLSLLLILLILAVVLFAALDPTLGGTERSARSVVVLLDASASMKTMDGNEEGTNSRMDVAKAKTKELIDSMGGGDVAMVMKVDGQATPMTRFSNDAPMLGKLVDGITASDTPADLTRALAAAADALRDRKNPLIVIVSDGAFPEQQLGMVTWDKPTAPAPAPAGTAAWNAKDLAAIDLSNMDVRFIPVGRRSDNVGIISFNVRRYIANRAAYEVYIEIENFGTEPAKRQLALYNGDVAVDVRTIELAPGQQLKRTYPKLPGSDDNKLRASLRPVDGPGGTDAFALDDQAFALLPERKKQKVLMVTDDNLYLENALDVYENVIAFKITPAEYDKNPSLADGHEVVIFDDHTPSVLPPPPTSLLFFHPSGPNSPFTIRGEIQNPRVTEVDEGHPVMRWITMSDVFMDKSTVFAPNAKLGESALAYSVRDPLVVTKRDGRRKMIAFGFSLPSLGRDGATDLPLRVAFPMLLVNTLDWFAGDQSDLLTTYSTGVRERIPLDGLQSAVEAEVKGPDGTITKTPVIDGHATFYGPRIGYYDVSARAPDGSVLAQQELAANLASRGESDIAPSTELSLAGKKLDAPEAFAISRSKKLWIYLVLLAMALIVMEWVTYHRRITV